MKGYQFKIMTLTYKALHGNAPYYICELLNWYHPNRHLQSENYASLVPNRHESIKYGKRHLDTAAAMLWNTLPNVIKCALTITLFKRLLKTYLFLVVKSFTCIIMLPIFAVFFYISFLFTFHLYFSYAICKIYI